MTAVFGTPKAWFFNKKSQKKFRIELLGLLLAITALIETGSMAGILEKLKWESIMKRRRDSRLIILYKGLKGAASIPADALIPPIRRSRNHRSMTFKNSAARTDIYKGSFFPQTMGFECPSRFDYYLC